MRTAMPAVMMLVAMATVAMMHSGVKAGEPASASNTFSIAQLTPDGKLRKPADLASWIFVGTSLGMGYNPGSFNASRPGQFQVVLMEPKAWRHFMDTGSYAPGTMLLLSFYDADTRPRSINQNGFTQAELTNFEIHLIDPQKNADGRVFYAFGAKAMEGSPLPPGNACARCHNAHGAFNGTFAQFYPSIRPLIPKEALERALRDHDIR